jgi:hypothetical protein
MKEKTYIFNQHEENTDWLKRIDFYRDELAIMKGRLEEIASKNSRNEVLVQIEHFQNQLLIQRDNMDLIEQAIHMNEKELLDEINLNPTAVDHRKVEYHEREEDLVLTFEKHFQELRGEFNRFLSKWM